MSTETSAPETYQYMSPAARVGRSQLTGHWIVDPDCRMGRQGYRRYESALAEAERRTARDLRSLASAYKGSARIHDPAYYED